MIFPLHFQTIRRYKCYESVKMANVKVICWGGGNFVPCHYHTNVCKISRHCKAISSLSLKVSSLNLVGYCKLPLLSPGLSAGTLITKETNKANSRVLLGALLFVCNVSFVVRNLCLVNYRRNLYGPIPGEALVRGSLRYLISRPIFQQCQWICA